MPQMSPMDWIMLMIYFLIIYFIFLINLYFIIKINLNFKKINLDFFSYLNKWY